jgi:subtilisin family serine protease
VRYILPRVMPRTSNNVAAGLIGQTFAAGARPPALGLAGQGEVVAVCDTGLDTGDADNLHPDFAGRVLAIKSYPISPSWRSDVLNAGADDGAADTDSGHGTHVAGSVLGNGSASAAAERRIEGMAPKAQLVFQAVEQEVRWRAHVPRKIATERFQLAGIPDDLTPLLDWARRKGARIHSNSWGGGEPGEYDAQCGQIDRFVWQHDDFVVLVAAGNDGSDTGGAGLPANGRINTMSISSPATAKNVITVGASENLRREFDDERYGDWWPHDFPRAPFRTAPMADDPRQIAAFSGRGPTLDGRIKPEVVAPGTFILSTRSSQIGSNNFGWGAWGPNKRDYFHMGGTSMATPIVAGAVALLREYLRKRAGIARPSAALVKALLIAGARPLQPIDGAPADNDQGFGCVDLRRSLQRVLLLHESKRSLRTGEHAGLRLALPRNGARVRVVLAYTDFPGPQLVNNLNLFVIDPQGRPRAGNAVGRGEAALTLDARNNVELVDVNTRSGGAWGIEVVAANVPQGPQPFALAVVRVN